MSRKIDLPAKAHVRAVLADMRAEAAAGGAKPSMLALARRLELSNATFWRHFRDIAAEIRHTAGDSMAQPGGQNPWRDRAGELASQNAGLRRERDRLADQMEPALGHLRRLTMDNAEPRHDLEAARKITRLDPAANHPRESDVKPFAAINCAVAVRNGHPRQHGAGGT
jgi:AcrR family transcriptional regulator